MKKQFSLYQVYKQNQNYCKYILYLFHAHLFSFETSVVDCILILIYVCVTSIYAYRNYFCEHFLNIYAFRNFILPQKDNDNICLQNVNCVYLNEFQMHIYILIMCDAGK